MKNRILKGTFILVVALPAMAISYFHRARKSDSVPVAFDQVAHTSSSSQVADDNDSAEGNDDDSIAKADYREKSVALHDRLAKVTVYSDRAALTRSGKIKLKPGTQWVKFDEIASGFFPNSARVSLGSGFSGKILQVAGEQVFAKGILKAETRGKIEHLRELYGQLLGLSQRAAATDRQLSFVRELKFDAPFQRTPASAIYRPFSANMDSLRTSIDEIHSKTSTLLSKSEGLQSQMADLRERIALVENELRTQASTRDQDWKTTFFVLVESKENQTAGLDLQYQVPNALWRPIYDIRAELDHEKGVADIKLVTAGMIEQKTGEDWKQVGVTLSSLDPVSLYLPKMDRRLLSERRTAAPVPMRAERKQKAVAHQAVNSVALDALSDRVSAKEEGMAAPAAPAASALNENVNSPMEKDVSGGGARAKAAGMAGGKLNALKKTAAEPAEDGRSPASLFTLEGLETIYPQLGNYTRALIDADRSQRVQPLDTRLSSAAPEKTNYADSGLPAVQAHGRRIEFVSPFPVDVKTDESPLKVPVHTQSLIGKLSYYAIPKSDARVFLRAQTTNTTDRPILGGAAQVYMEGDLVSKTELGTVSEDSFFNVDLGVDRNVETKRIVSRNSKTSGIISSTHHTQVGVKIELANHHPYAIDMEVKDNYPRSPDKKIEATLTEVVPDVEKSEKDYGVITWKVHVPAKSKKTVSFTYEVAHPDNYLVSEFN